MCLAFDHRAPASQVTEFRNRLIGCEEVVSCCDLQGAFDFMIELALPDLKAYNTKLETLKADLAALVARYETNFVCNRLVRVSRANADRAVWVTCKNGLKRIESSFVDKVKADGDYMCVHAGGHCWMIHLTMNEILAELGSDQFVRLHRSTIVRSTFIDRLIHEGHLWTARLNDGCDERIARSHVAEVMNKVRRKAPAAIPSN
ncbi:LytTR family transcriptional regulator DNA-binding domain-containing protein [Sphingomonas sp.]|uniref:LytTR family transcriptional regulator DNA-binding domain-containing protein n=1 Tax=Sphingomonas sp. TaxID=28214 RepID=UPI0025ED3DCD|nr:LytTR family transcriptional regulator DNA-binding domain-containing protein [Sphingomonas sp.]